MPVTRFSIRIGREEWDVTRHPEQPETKRDVGRSGIEPSFVGLEFRREGHSLRLPLSAGSLPSRDEFMKMSGLQLMSMLSRASGVE